MFWLRQRTLQCFRSFNLSSCPDKHLRTEAFFFHINQHKLCCCCLCLISPRGSYYKRSIFLGTWYATGIQFYCSCVSYFWHLKQSKGFLNVINFARSWVTETMWGRFQKRQFVKLRTIMLSWLLSTCHTTLCSLSFKKGLQSYSNRVFQGVINASNWKKMVGSRETSHLGIMKISEAGMGVIMTHLPK